MANRRCGNHGEDLFQNRQIRLRPCEGGEIPRRAPHQPLVFERLQMTASDATTKRQQANAATLIRPKHRIERSPHRYLHPEFLPQFTGERGFRRLTRVHLAAGKFPPPGQMFPLGAQAGKKPPALVLNHGAHHIDHALTVANPPSAVNSADLNPRKRTAGATPAVLEIQVDE